MKGKTGLKTVNESEFIVETRDSNIFEYTEEQLEFLNNHLEANQEMST